MGCQATGPRCRVEWQEIREDTQARMCDRGDRKEKAPEGSKEDGEVVIFGWNGSVKEMEVVMMMSSCKHGYFNSSHKLQQEHRSKEATAKWTGRRLARLLPSLLLLVCVSIFLLQLLQISCYVGRYPWGSFLRIWVYESDLRFFFFLFFSSSS